VGDPGRAAVAEDAEQWFLDHGLPWFVDDHRERVRAGLASRRLTVVGAVTAFLGIAVGGLVGWAAADPSVGVAAGLTAAGLVAAGYGLRTLYGGAVLRWAARQTLGSLNLLFNLAARALPLLLLFITFLFINTEVWEIASRLDGGVMWAAILLFASIAVGFLLARLPEELEVFDKELTRERLVSACAGSPLSTFAGEVELTDEEMHERSDVVGLERANLLLVLLITQAIQVLLLSLAVWLFFLVFGVVAMDETVLQGWLGYELTYPWGQPWVSRELLRVATFLAAFAGLYFTVYAVTDVNYRHQFFSRVTRELERAVGVRVLYRTLRD
jgi:hypothetical protein